MLLARWRTREIDIAHSFRECTGTGTAEIEEILDSTITALLPRSYSSEEHLFAALRKGVKMRALRLHRDRVAHEYLLSHTAPALYGSEQERAWKDEPERVLIAREDDLIISEFLADLSRLEREVFVLHADGRSWRAIARSLDLPESEARTLTRRCERKRERFLTLYLSGRLCGYRSQTISNLLSGALLGDTDLALDQALIHLGHCRACQAEHSTTSEELRSTFDRRVLGLLPIPALAHWHMVMLDRMQAIAERPLRFLARFAPSRGVSTREHLVEKIAGAGSAAKLATAAILSVALVAGGTLALHPSHHPHTSRVRTRSQPSEPAEISTPGSLARTRAGTGRPTLGVSARASRLQIT